MVSIITNSGKLPTNCNDSIPNGYHRTKNGLYVPDTDIDNGYIPPISPKESDALEMASSYHRNEFRQNGEPFINHPISVVNILKNLTKTNPKKWKVFIDSSLYAAGYLHDVPEDCRLMFSLIERECGKKTAYHVFHVTRTNEREKYAESFLYKDTGTQLLKLADVIDNTKDFKDKRVKLLSKDKIEHKITEIHDIFLPLASRICPEFYTALLYNMGPLMDYGYLKKKRLFRPDLIREGLRFPLQRVLDRRENSEKYRAF